MASSTIEEPKLPGGYLVTPRVPQGLAAAVEGLTREVIRHSPEDIYVFAAHHFEKLLIIRRQCGIDAEKPKNHEASIETLREMSRALKMREIDRDNARTSRGTIDQVGWSLNQTAKVLKRHRSIFGDEGRKITTDEVFGMAVEKENRSVSPKLSARKLENRGAKRSIREKPSFQKSDDVWKASTSRTEYSLSNEDSIESTNVNVDRTRIGPKIITQIPSLPSGTIMLAKDIKTELRKNRMSSRERRNVRARPEDKNITERTDSRVVNSIDKVYSSKKPCDKQKIIETEMKVKRNRGNYESTRSSSSSKKQRENDKSQSKADDSKKREENLIKRAPRMDRVKDYVVERFATSSSLEELQTSNYVEKVQEIIDETGPIIKEKIEQLKSVIVGRSDQNFCLADERKNCSRESDDFSREKIQNLSRRKNSSDNNEKSKSLINDALRIRLTETQKLMENVSSSITRSSRRSRSARSSRRSENLVMPDETSISRNSQRDDSCPFERQDSGLETRLSKTRDLLEDISSTMSRPTRRSTSAKYSRKYHETTDDEGESKDALRKRLDETRNLLRGISTTFGNTMDKASGSTETRESEESSSLSVRRESSKMSLPAVRTMSVRNNSSGSGISRSDSDSLVLPAISPESTRSAKIRENLILPVLSPSCTVSTNEDSSRIIDNNDDVALEDFDIPENPVEDYTMECSVDNVSRDSLNVTPNFDSIPQRPDSLEPVEIIDERDSKDFKIGELEGIITAVDNVKTEILGVDDVKDDASEIDNLETAEPSKVVDEESKPPGLGVNIETKILLFDEPRAKTLDTDDFEGKISIDRDLEAITSTTDDHEAKLRETRKFERDIVEASGPVTTIDSRELENSVTINAQPELERENIDGQMNFAREAEREIMSVEESETERVKADETGENNETRLEEAVVDESRTISPEPVNYTYVLTEGSPYDIPDTVTTVIIPERILDSPLSDRLNVELEDGLEAKLFLIPGDRTIKTSIQEAIETNIVDSIDKDVVKLDIDEKMKNYSDEKIAKSSKNNIEKERATSHDVTTKNLPQSVDKNDYSPKSPSDPFGELVEHEIVATTSMDTDLIREIESIQDIQISRQDLGRINEEISEDLEDHEELNDETGIVKNIDITKEENEKSRKDIEDIEKEWREEEKNEKNYVQVDESVITESDLSPEATRPYIDSESSNETKESGPAEEQLYTIKRENSIDDEGSSETRTIDSSNEVKETTLTDGPLSLSLDPTRPFVPELNLDSLQDITVSSFKMTEEDYDNQERGENENTNSITDTLTSDENNRTNDNVEFTEEAAVEYIASSSSGSDSNETGKDTRNEESEAAEETIVKSRVKVKEDLCQKKSTYVTGPSREEDKNVDRDEDQLAKVEREKGTMEKDGKEKSTGRENIENVMLGKYEEDTTKEEKEVKIVSIKDSYDSENVEIVKMAKEEESIAKSVNEEIVKTEDSNESCDEVETVEMKKEEEIKTTEVREEMVKMENSKESEKMEIVEIKKDEGSTSKSEKEEIVKIEDSNESGHEVEIVEMKKEEESTPKSDKEEITKTKDSNESEKVDIVKAEKEEEGTWKSDKEEIMQMKDSNESEKEKIVKIEDSNESEKEEIVKIEDSNEREKIEIVEMEKEEDSTPKSEKEEITKMKDSNESEKEEIVKIEDSNEREKVEIVEMEKEEDSTPKSEKEEITKIKDSNDSEKEEIVKIEVSNESGENVEIVEMKKDEEGTVKSEKEEIIKIKDSNESEKVKIVKIVKEEESTEKSDKEEIVKMKQEDEEEPDSSLSHERLEYEVAKGDEEESRSSERNADAKFQISNSRKKEEIASDLDGNESWSEKMLKNFNDDTEQSSTDYDKAENLSEAMPTGEEEYDDITEENFVDDETPLAVSRSASQCTTRRVSSGNLAKLREDPILGWTEEIELENNVTENDTSGSSRVKFSGLNDDVTMEKRGSKEMDESVVITRDVSDETNENSTTKDSAEFHIYLPEVDASDDNSTTESSTFDSAVTKIQAGVRGFLARRRLQRGQQNRSSTLSGIPSIQDSIAIEPRSTDDQDREASIEKFSSREELRISSPKASIDNCLVNAATKIQSNYRGYEARKRLRREDAVQRTTLSLEKSFAESGLQHTGEFHDCVPLPISDIAIENKKSNLPKNSSAISTADDKANKNTIESLNEMNFDELALPKSLLSIDDDRNDSTALDREKITAKTSFPLDQGQIFVGQSSNIPIVKFDTKPSVSRLVDLVVLAKNDEALQSGYLNFITSVEDTETIVGSTQVPLSASNVREKEENSSSLKEPLALSDSPIFATIEEVTSSGAENFMKIHDERERTMASTDSSVLTPEVIEESVSASTRSHRADGNSSSRSEAGKAESESSKMTSEAGKNVEEPEKMSRSTNLEKTDESVVHEKESLVQDFTIPESLSSIEEKELLGPESCVDSMECPVVRNEEKDTRKVTKETRKKITSPERDSSDRLKNMDERTKEQVSIVSDADEASSMLSFSMRVEDLLGFGSEDSVESYDKKPILQVTLTPGDLMKSKDLSQDSQLAGERIESPITMIQIAPERSESPKHDELSDNGDDDDTTNGKKVHGSSSARLNEK